MQARSTRGTTMGVDMTTRGTGKEGEVTTGVPSPPEVKTWGQKQPPFQAPPSNQRFIFSIIPI